VAAEHALAQAHRPIALPVPQRGAEVAAVGHAGLEHPPSLEDSLGHAEVLRPPAEVISGPAQELPGGRGVRHSSRPVFLSSAA
jgi:hypothetical protein